MATLSLRGLVGDRWRRFRTWSSDAGPLPAVAFLVLAIHLAGVACAADCDTAQPKTDREWRRITDGVIRSVDIHGEENRTNISLEPRQAVRLIPNPVDTWATTWRDADTTPVTWRGDCTQPVGWTKQLQVKTYAASNANNGTPDKDKWIDVEKLPNGIWTGPGEIVLRGKVDRALRGTCVGVIRVKIVPVR